MFVPFGLKFGDAKRCSFRLARTMAFCFIAVAILAANIRARSSLAFGPGASDVSPSLSLQTVEESITESPESLAVALERALSKGQNETAQEILSQILKRPHVNADLLLKVGAGLAQRELYAEASQVFARCVGENPGIFEAHYDLALAEFAQQKLPEALAAEGCAARVKGREPGAFVPARENRKRSGKDVGCGARPLCSIFRRAATGKLRLRPWPFSSATARLLSSRSNIRARRKFQSALSISCPRTSSRAVSKRARSSIG